MDHRSAAVEAPPSLNAKVRWASIARFVPYALALLFLALSLRGVGADNVVDTDAARHSLNGAFIHDLIRSGSSIRHPYNFALHYYARLPALSLPFHPPLFPAVEAMLFSVFGVSVFTARLTVALAVAATVILLYRLVLSNQKSLWIAAMATLAFCFWRPAQAVAGDVMLEYPAMALVVAALWFVRDLSKGYPLSRGIWFAILAGAAVWTKQHAVFLGAVPFAWILFSGSWKLLREKTIWISSALFAVEVGALGLITIPFKGAGVNQVAPVSESGAIFLYNLRYYRDCVMTSIGPWIAGAVVLLIFADWAFRRAQPKKAQNTQLYWAWACCSFTVLLLIGPYDIRYLFFVLPPVLVIVYTSLAHLGISMFGERNEWVLPVVVGAFCATLGLQVPAVYIHGPSEAAAMIVDGSPQVVFYCGSTDGNFIFSVRERDPHFRSAVVAGDKIPANRVSPAAFDDFARTYGIRRIVLEHSTRPQACDALRLAPTSSMSLDREIPLVSSNPRWQGSLSVYSFKNPNQSSTGQLVVPVEKLGRDLVLDLN